MSIEQRAQAFFSAYAQHDVNAMLACFTSQAQIHYVPLALQGSVHPQGADFWRGLISAFPNLHLRVDSIVVARDLDSIVAEVLIGGTQCAELAGIPNAGKSFLVPHVFILKFGPGALISEIKAYWDQYQLLQMLGVFEQTSEAER